MKQVMGHDLVADSLGSLFAWRARETPQEIGFRFEDQMYTYADMKRMVDRVRASLRRDGAQPGDRIAAFMHNSPWLLALFLATAMDRLVYCPINVGSRRDDLSYFIRDIEPFAVFVDEALVEVFQSASLDGLTARRILLGDASRSSPLIHFEQWLESVVEPLPDSVIEPSDPLCIMYSGGTTGLPKGIVMPQFAPVAAALRFNGIAKFKHRENFFTTLQLSHAWTPLLVLPFCLYYGHVFCFWKWWSASGFVPWSRKFDASLVDPFIGMIATLLQTPETSDDGFLQSARLIGGLGGADPVAMRIRAEFEKRFGAATFDLYGFTEITGLAAVETEYHARKPGSSGRLTGWYEVAVVDAHDVPLPAHETGELVLRPRVPHTVGLGYHRKPDVTVATWR
ncbi:MAG: AMP-binding protein, partial [Burkholderiales bacterium]